jgi:two-component system, NarL family, response regulator YdfI
MKSFLHILLVAASPARRLWLSDLVRASFTREAVKVVTSAGLSREILGQAAAHILLVDVVAPAAAASMVEVLRDSPGAVGSVALLDDPDPRWVGSALEAGVNAIIPRDTNPEDLHLAIGAAEAGLVLLHPSSVRNLAARRLQPPAFDHDVEQLTAREREVLRLISEGLGNKEIAARLAISEHTAKFHISSILGKLSVASRTEAVSQGIKKGLIPI